MEEILDAKNRKWFYLLAALFVVALSGAIALENYYFLLAPIFLLIVYVAFFNLDKLYLFIVFCTPLSITLEEFGVETLGLHLPTEPMLFGVLILFIMKQFFQGTLDKAFLKHPVTIAFGLYLAWMFLACITSENPLISWKFFVVKLWFIVPIYFFGVQVFKKQINIKRSIWFFLVPLIIAAMYTLIRHATFSFGEEEGHWVMSPFFKDHTSYGAILALYYPIAFLLLTKGKHGIPIKVVLATFFTILTLALIFSYTRAAWVSIVGAIGVYGLIYFKIKFKWLLGIGIVAGALLTVNWTQIQMRLEKNKAEHATDDFGERIESVSNITSDASNLERLNLWESSIRMFLERPVMGWGPGTFQFNYGSFQQYKDLTIISVKSGRSVNTHSEYLGPLAESGVIGALTFLGLVITILYTSITLYMKLPPGEMRFILLGTMLGLITYFMHGVLNSYLDTDKASVGVWSLTAVVVAIDIYHKDRLIKEAASEDATA